MPVVHCPHCQASVEILQDDLGFRVACPACTKPFQAGETVAAAPEPVSAPSSTTPPEEPTAAGVPVECPHCKERIEINADDVGHRVECPHCTRTFEARTEAEREESAPRKRRRRDEDLDDYENDTDYGRRRRKYRPEEREYILNKAKRTIAWPANGLMWTGIAMLVIYALLAVGMVLRGIYQLQSNDRYQRDDAVVLFVFAVLFGIFGLPHASILAYGGYQMKKLRGTGWAYTGAAFGIATIALSHPCSPTTWAAVAFGIWGIIAMSQREVKDAIAINTGKGI